MTFCFILFVLLKTFFRKK